MDETAKCYCGLPATHFFLGKPRCDDHYSLSTENWDNLSEEQKSDIFLKAIEYIHKAEK